MRVLRGTATPCRDNAGTGCIPGTARARVGDSGADQSELIQVSDLLSDKHRWLNSEDLRYCPACIRCGMHYRYQQDYRFRSCIVHLKRLRTGCPTCGGSLDTKGQSSQGFVCARCDAIMLGADTFEPRAPARTAWDTFILDELESWQREAEELNKGYQRPGTDNAVDLWSGLSKNAHAGLYWHALRLNPNLRVGAALVPASRSFRLLPTSSLSRPLNCCMGHSMAEQVVRPYIMLLRDVSRHLRRTVLRGHGFCARYAAVTIGGLGRGLNPEVRIQPDLCCLGQGYALWQLQWKRSLKEMPEYLRLGQPGERDAEIRLPGLGAAQLNFVSSFEHWVEAMAVIREEFSGTGKLARIDGVGAHPHWALMQPGAFYTCPIHFRHPDLRALSHCDHGAVLRQQIESHRAIMRRIHRLS